MVKPRTQTEKLSHTQSVRGLFWQEPDLNPAEISKYAQKTGLDEVLASLLLARGVGHDGVEAFLNPTLKNCFPQPSSFQDMDLAAEIISSHILNGRKVAVFADYDVDGATSAAQLIRYFRHFDQELVLYVPDRLKEGYGPSPDAFDQLKSQNVELVITVDCGAAATNALSHALDINLPVIVIDHHLMGEDIPECTALVNPNRPDCLSGQGHLAAAGVVYVLLVALNRELRTRHGFSPAQLPDLIQYLDLCALGTLCDMAPLKGVNRAFVVQGLKIISRDETKSFLAMSQVSGRSAPRRVSDLTFGIGPQLNAGGRIGDPWLATKLMAAETMDEALPIAEQLFALNEARKAVENDILESARRQIERRLHEHPDLKVLIAGDEGWHPGVIGIVAGRLKDEFHRPVIIIGWGDTFGDLAKGSARSVTGVNIGNAISKAAKDGLLISGGGHAMAGGLSMQVDRFEEFCGYMSTLLANTEDHLQEARMTPISADVIGASLHVGLLEIIEKAGPYGAGAPKPLFRIKDTEVVSRRLVGKNHLKLVLYDGSAQIDAIAWRADERPIGEALQKGQHLDVLGYLEKNSWQGRDRVQFEIFDAMLIN